MKQLFCIVFTLIICLPLQVAYGQFKALPLVNLFFKNQFDKQGLHHGRWVVKSNVPANNVKTKTKGYYQHGFMVGEWRTYAGNKKLQKLEKCRIENGMNIIETTEFYPNGQVAVKGFAAMEFANGNPHYYRHGSWIYYKDDASLDKTVVYEKGWPAKTTYANGKTEISPAPQNNARFYNPGEVPDILNKPGTESMAVTKDKAGRSIMIHRKANGDSTITIMKRVGWETDKEN